MANPFAYNHYVKCPYCLYTQDPKYANKLDFDCIDRKRCALQLLAVVEERIAANPYGLHPSYALAEIRKEVRNG